MIASAVLMSIQPVIDGFEFAELGRKLAGSWRAADFPRLQDVLAGESGALEWSLAGVRDDRGRPGLRVRIQGTLRIACQRCLGILELPVRIDSTLVLAGSLAGMNDVPLEPAAPDFVLGSREMSVRVLLEDELLLAIPYAPRHESCGVTDDRPVADTRRASPFAGLGGLVGGKPDGERIKRG
jgi:uncharacterized protein